MTNAQCAERAARTLLAYRQLVGEVGSRRTRTSSICWSIFDTIAIT
jgi:hypothetical protein